MPATNNNGYFIRSDTKPPCTPNCKDRKKLCHTECKKYIDWKNNYDNVKKEIIKVKNSDKEIEDYKVSKQKNKKER
jgi:hypothetical protein